MCSEIIENEWKVDIITQCTLILNGFDTDNDLMEILNVTQNTLECGCKVCGY